MIIQALTKPQNICNQFACLPQTGSQCAQPLRACPQDLGYEIDEDELASELLEQLLGKPSCQAAPEVDLQGFEKLYGWFLS